MRFTCAQAFALHACQNSHKVYVTVCGMLSYNAFMRQRPCSCLGLLHLFRSVGKAGQLYQGDAA
eukprot:5759589-Pleurochrysis_carterae.AAC.1